MPAYCACGDKVDEAYDYVAAAQVSPMEPPMLPLSRDAASGMTSVADSLSRGKQCGTCGAVGVARIRGSGRWPCGRSRRKGNQQEHTACQCRIENVASLRPPNAILAMAMVNTAPAAVIHHGSDAGRLRASRTPVRSAEQSPSVDGRFSINRVIAHSVSIAAAEDMTECQQCRQSESSRAHSLRRQQGLPVHVAWRLMWCGACGCAAMVKDHRTCDVDINILFLVLFDCAGALFGYSYKSRVVGVTKGMSNCMRRAFEAVGYRCSRGFAP